MGFREIRKVVKNRGDAWQKKQNAQYGYLGTSGPLEGQPVEEYITEYLSQAEELMSKGPERDLNKSRKMLDDVAGYLGYNSGQVNTQDSLKYLKALGKRERKLLSLYDRGDKNYPVLEGRVRRTNSDILELEERVRRRRMVWAFPSIVGILGGIFFLSSNITGNAIANMTTKTTSFLGAGLLIVGLVAGFFWVKSRKK